MIIDILQKPWKLSPPPPCPDQPPAPQFGNQLRQKSATKQVTHVYKTSKFTTPNTVYIYFYTIMLNVSIVLSSVEYNHA